MNVVFLMKNRKGMHLDSLRKLLGCIFLYKFFYLPSYWRVIPEKLDEARKWELVYCG